MYILIFEDGHVAKANVVTESDLDACDQGVLDVVDISDPSNPKRYDASEWHPLMEAFVGL